MPIHRAELVPAMLEYHPPKQNSEGLHSRDRLPPWRGQHAACAYRLVFQTHSLPWAHRPHSWTKPLGGSWDCSEPSCLGATVSRGARLHQHPDTELPRHTRDIPRHVVVPQPAGAPNIKRQRPSHPLAQGQYPHLAPQANNHPTQRASGLGLRSCVLKHSRQDSS